MSKRYKKVEPEPGPTHLIRYHLQSSEASWEGRSDDAVSLQNSYETTELRQKKITMATGSHGHLTRSILLATLRNYGSGGAVTSPHDVIA